MIRRAGMMNVSPPNINPQARITVVTWSPEAFAADRIFPDKWKHIVLPESHKPFLIRSASSYAWFSNDFVFSSTVEGLHSSRHPNSCPYLLTVTCYFVGNLRNILLGSICAFTFLVSMMWYLHFIFLHFVNYCSYLIFSYFRITRCFLYCEYELYFFAPFFCLSWKTRLRKSDSWKGHK